MRLEHNPQCQSFEHTDFVRQFESAKVLFGEGRHKQCFEQLETIHSSFIAGLDPAVQENYYLLFAHCAFVINDTTKALTLYQSVIAFNPQNNTAKQMVQHLRAEIHCSLA